MTIVRVVAARLLGMLTRRQRDAALEDEIQAHLALLTDDYVRAGLPALEARRAAARAFGGLLQVREAHRDERAWVFASHLVRDVRLALRRAASEPRQMAVIALTIGLGVGANAAMLDAAHAILFRPLPVPRPQEVVMLDTLDRQTGRYVETPYAHFQDYAAKVPALRGLAAYTRLSVATLDDDRVRTMPAEFVTPNYFSLLEVPALAGTTLDAHRASAEWPLVAMVAEDTWRTRFAADSGVVGRPIDLNGRPFTVVGIVPRSFGGHNLNWYGRPALWVPLDSVAVLEPGSSPEHLTVLMMGRLRPDAGIDQLQAQADLVARRLSPSAPGTNQDVHAVAFPAGRSKFYPGHRPTVERSLVAFVIASGFVFAMACCNLVTLAAERNMRRRREIAVRLALGGSRGRIVQQQLVEGLVLAMPGTVVAIAAAAAVQRAVNTFPAIFGIGLALDLSITWQTVALALAFSLGMAALLAVPAVRLDRRLTSHLELDHRAGWRRRWLGLTPVAAQIVVSAALLAGAFLVVRSVLAGTGADAGFDRPHVLMAAYDYRPGYDLNEGRAMVLRAAGALEGVPGIESVSPVSHLPLDGVRQPITASTPAHHSPRIEASQVLVGSAFFSTTRIALARGRPLNDSDVPQAYRVGVVSASLAARLWPHSDPIGQTLMLAHGHAAPERVEVVGVARDVSYFDPWGSRRLLVYRLDDPDAKYVPSLLVRTSRPAELSLTDVRRALGRSAKDAALLRYIRTADDQIDRAVGPERSAGVFLAVAAGLAMLVAGVGLHYALSYTVQFRRREIAVRIAVGGAPLAVSSEILRRSALLALAATVAGTLASAGFTPLLAAQAKGVSPRDTLTFLAVGAVLLAGCSAVAACSMARAARTNLTESLRVE